MKLWMLALGLLALAPAAAVAGDGDIADLPNLSVGVNWNFQDVHAFFPSTFGLQPAGGAVAGLGLTYKNRLSSSDGWFVDAGAGIGWGGDKVVDETIDVTQKANFTSIYGNAGLGYMVPITKKVSAYGSGRLFYSTTTLTADNGTTEEDGEPFKVFGVEKALGGSVKIGERYSLYGEHYSQFGWGSGKGNDTRYNETVKYGCYRGGLLMHF